MLSEKKTIYIFDAGGSKTDVLIYKDGQTKTQTLSGYNPNRLDTYFNREIIALDIPKEVEIYFYGSGINNKLAVNQVKNLFHTQNIIINGDILGAARATLQNKKGIVCIMGTGGICAYYDGKKIVQKNGGYGFLIDDYGGGLELSKIIVSNWLNKNYSAKTTQAISSYFETKVDEFIPVFYQTKNLHKLSNVCSIIIELAKKDKTIDRTIQEYFDLFFSRHVYPLCKKENITNIDLIGSIADYFEDWINASAKTNNISIRKIIRKPISNLLDFHLKTDNHL